MTFSFTPTAGGALAVSNTVTLTYPLNFFAVGVTPSSVTLSGVATANSAASGASSIVITLQTGSAAASTAVTVTLVGMTMGATPTAGGAVTVSTSQDLVVSASTASGYIGGAVTSVAFSISDSNRFTDMAGVSVSFSFSPSFVGALASGATITLGYPAGFFASGIIPSGVEVSGAATATCGASGVSSIVVALQSGTVPALSAAAITLNGLTMGASGTVGGPVTVATSQDPIPSAAIFSGNITCFSSFGRFCPALFGPIKCCPIGTFANVSGLSQCFNCASAKACTQPCTVVPNCDCNDASSCDMYGCPPGCYFTPTGKSCIQAPAGSYTQCSSSNCSASANALVNCLPGTSSLSVGGFSNQTCIKCPSGTYCPDHAEVNPQPCQPGTYSQLVGATSCNPCEAGSFSADMGSYQCSLCSPGTYCRSGASQQCRCHINSYQPDGGQSFCTSCVGQAVPSTGQTVCATEVATSALDVTMYKWIIGAFAVILFGSVCLFLILLRSRHTFSVRPFHYGICFYIASFAPYALIKVVAIIKLLEAKTQQEQQTAGLVLNSSFMIFFWLGFGGKMALIQLWMHLIQRHVGIESEQALLASAVRTWSLMRRTVIAVCLLYSVGFVALVGLYSQASGACAATASSDFCIPVSFGDTPPPCLRVLDFALGITYYEGAFAAVVVVVFTFYALLFNGLVYAMLTSDASFSNLSKLQRMLISNAILRWLLRPYVLYVSASRMPSLEMCRFIPPSWRPSSFKTSGDLEMWRTSLRALGIKLAAVSICSFACKAVLVALQFFDVVSDGSALYLSLSTLIVEALPSILTITLLALYHIGSLGAARGGSTAMSLLTKESITERLI